MYLIPGKFKENTIELDIFHYLLNNNESTSFFFELMMNCILDPVNKNIDSSLWNILTILYLFINLNNNEKQEIFHKIIFNFQTRIILFLKSIRENNKVFISINNNKL